MRNHTITLASLNGGEVLSRLSLLLKALPKEGKKIIVELPCAGQPSVAYTLEKAEEIQQEQTMNQLLMDMDQGQPRPIQEYVIHRGNLDYLIMDPRSQLEAASMGMPIRSELLMSLPGYLRQQLSEHYKWILLVTQEALMHPMTHFSACSSDATVLYNATYLQQKLEWDHFAVAQMIQRMSGKRSKTISAHRKSHLKRNPLDRLTDEERKDQMQRIVCETRVARSDALQQAMGIRREKVIRLMALMAEEGFLTPPACSKSGYTIAWDEDQIQSYLDANEVG